MRILITGASGLVGSALSSALGEDGHSVGRFVRPGPPAGKGDVAWNPATGEMDMSAAEGADAVVNLAGASIGGCRWTEERKTLLRTSRVNLTERLVRNFEQLRRRPAVLVSASAIGYYGDRGDEALVETSAPGKDFLPQLSSEWEAAAMGAEKLGIRTVITRFGIVLAKNGGALPRMLTPFKMGVGGKLGSGKQWMSWVALDDVVGAIREAIMRPSFRGPVNVVAPNPVRNADFTRVLARVLHRPALFPAPAFVLRLMLGEMADALLLSSQRVVPQKLLDDKFPFKFAELETALRHALEA
ncbi:MAG: TIGR01777 family oxidoreductase [Candidatus Acidiferrales bacterium]|jgi:uncharacterized protein (TIGR01777 family)